MADNSLSFKNSYKSKVFEQCKPRSDASQCDTFDLGLLCVLWQVICLVHISFCITLNNILLEVKTQVEVVR